MSSSSTCMTWNRHSSMQITQSCQRDCVRSGCAGQAYLRSCHTGMPPQNRPHLCWNFNQAYAAARKTPVDEVHGGFVRVARDKILKDYRRRVSNEGITSKNSPKCSLQMQSKQGFSGWQLHNTSHADCMN